MAALILLDDKVILKDVSIANNFWSRLSGYMFRKYPHVPGILFLSSGSMQTSFMRFNLDIIFLNEKNVVIEILKNVKPWRFTKIYSKVSKVLEVPAESLPSDLKKGSVLQIVST